MTNRVTLPSQDFQKMCKQAERDHEARKLVILMERVRQQIAARNESASTSEAVRASVTPINVESGTRIPSRSAPFER